MRGTIGLFIQATKELVLKSGRKGMIIVVIKLLFGDNFTKKYIKSFFDFFGRF